eukprot:3459940-Rhodomonas_salina.1
MAKKAKEKSEEAPASSAPEVRCPNVQCDRNRERGSVSARRGVREGTGARLAGGQRWSVWGRGGVEGVPCFPPVQ